MRASGRYQSFIELWLEENNCVIGLMSHISPMKNISASDHYFIGYILSMFAI